MIEDDNRWCHVCQSESNILSAYSRVLEIIGTELSGSTLRLIRVRLVKLSNLRNLITLIN
jgi:hypothetical protein